MTELEKRKQKAEELKFDELIKFLPQYVSICNEINKDKTDIYGHIATDIMGCWATKYDNDRLAKVQNIIFNAFKERDYLTIYAIKEMLEKYEM